MDSPYIPVSVLENLYLPITQGDTWQSIDSAPKDGTQLLLFFPRFENPIQVGYYAIMEEVQNGKVMERDEYWKGKWMEYQFIRAFPDREGPTHWMRLPDAPVDVEAVDTEADEFGDDE